MPDDIALLGQACVDCGFPISTASTSSCPYCGSAHLGAHMSPADGTPDHLRGVLYGLPLVSLQRLKIALRAVGASASISELAVVTEPISEPLAEWVELQSDASAGATLGTVVDVLLTLWAVSEEPAPPDQLTDVIVKVADGAHDRLPLPPRGPCFCGSGKRYKKCHAR